jgi:hypothetical protein
MVRRQDIPAISEELQQVKFKHQDIEDAVLTSDIYTPKQAIVSRFIVGTKRETGHISEISDPVISTSGHPS